MDRDPFLGLLTYASQNNVSDIHFRVGSPPAFRVKGDLHNVQAPPFTPQDIRDICNMMIQDNETRKKVDSLFEIDGSFHIAEIGRFRYNIFRHMGELAAIVRLIPLKIASFSTLGLPDVLKKIAMINRGFVLVTGATGSGKSTTLAAMMDYVNGHRASHIITIEDPIEFMHFPKKSRFTQREVGRDTDGFIPALRSALRQDPDVIMVGEMRDAESVDIALKAAETGHSVFSSIHTTDAAKTIGRLIAMFPPEEQNMARLRLADVLRATVSQRLLKKVDGEGRVVALEIMLTNTAIQECIADPKRTSEITKFIENSSDVNGSRTFEQDIVRLYKSGVISSNTAKRASANPGDFERNLMYEKVHFNTPKWEGKKKVESEDDDKAPPKFKRPEEGSGISMIVDNVKSKNDDTGEVPKKELTKDLDIKRSFGVEPFFKKNKS
jgi:twitching motility protein PilT